MKCASLIALLAFWFCPAASFAEERLHVWVKAFIPNSHPGNSNYVKPIPGRSGQTMIPGPFDAAPEPIKDLLAQLNLDGCFATDNRSFSDSPTASARLTSEFDLVIGDGVARIEKVEGREVHRCNASEMLDCTNGQTKKEGTATPKAAVTGENFGIGTPQFADSQVQVIFQCAAANVLAPPGTPDIDYSLDLSYDTFTGVLKFKATLGSFPAFEAYVSRNDAAPKKLFNQNPVGDTVWSLWDFGTGLVTTRQAEGQIDLGGPSWLLGNWESTDATNRFRLEIHSLDDCKIIERGAVGSALTKRTTIKPLAGVPGLYRMERPNDAETVNFLFASSIRAEILARNPKPSFLDITRSDGLSTKWNGLLATKDQNKLKDLKQPGEIPARSYNFIRKP